MKIPFTGLELRLFNGGDREIVQLSSPTAQTTTKCYVYEKDGFLDRIIWPEFNANTDWEKLAVKKAMDAFFRDYKNNYVSIIELETIAKKSVMKKPAVEWDSDVGTKLRLVHCVYFSELPKSIIDEIPDLINQYFGTTRIEREVEVESDQTPSPRTKALLEKKE